MSRGHIIVASAALVVAVASGCTEGAMRSSRILLADHAAKGLPPGTAVPTAASVAAAVKANPLASVTEVLAAVAPCTAPAAHVTPFPTVIDFESYADTAALAADWNAFGRGDGYLGAVRLARCSSGKSLALDFTLGENGGGQSGVSLSTPWSKDVPNVWDLSGKAALALSARCEGGPVVVTFVCFCLDARSPSGQTPFFTRFEVGEETKTCYVSLAHLSRSGLGTPGSFLPDLSRIVNIQFLPDGLMRTPSTLVIDDIRPSSLPADFPRLTPPRGTGEEQYVTLTFDDCGTPDGLDWIHDELNCLGLRGSATLFLTTAYADPAEPAGWDWQRVRTAWRRFAHEGYELGNHTDTHNQDPNTGVPTDGTTMSVDAWKGELKTANDKIVAWTGVQPRIARAPRLEANSNYFTALTCLGYENDSSLQGGGFKFHPRSFPHTLHYGLAPDEWARLGPLPPFSLVNGEWVQASGPRYQQHAGTVGRHEVRSLAMSEWDRASSEIPIASFLENLTFRVYTPDAPTDVNAAAQVIIDDFERHYCTNRAPFHMAAHSQTLVDNPGTAALGETIDWRGRRQILDQVLRYMRSKKNVRFVRASELLDLQCRGDRKDRDDDRSEHRERDDRPERRGDGK